LDNVTGQPAVDARDRGGMAGWAGLCRVRRLRELARPGAPAAGPAAGPPAASLSAIADGAWIAGGRLPRFAGGAGSGAPLAFIAARRGKWGLFLANGGIRRLRGRRPISAGFAAGRVALIAALAFIAGNVASLGAPSYGALLALRLLSALAGASSWSFR
jgi:hypothetical protein